MKKLSNTEAELRKSVACKKGVIPEKIYCNTWIYLGNVWKGKDCFTKKTEKKKIIIIIIISILSKFWKDNTTLNLLININITRGTIFSV